MEGLDSPSASVKFFGGKFNLLNENKRLVIVLEEEVTMQADEEPLRVALIIIGGVGVNTITYDGQIIGKSIQKGQELSAFRAGGRYVVDNDVVSQCKTLRPKVLSSHFSYLLPFSLYFSAFALFSTKPMDIIYPLQKAADQGVHVEVLVGETLAH